MPAAKSAAPAAGQPVPVETRPVYADTRTGVVDTPIYRGSDLEAGHKIDGPLVIEETTTTIFVGAGDRLEIDEGGNYLIHIAEEGGGDGA